MLTWFLATLLAVGVQENTISGVVRDSSGGAVAAAVVVVRAPSGAEQQTWTGADGRFSVSAPAAGDLTLVVRADGFSETRQAISGTAEISIVLEPAALLETVVVTATRSEQRLRDVPASVSVVTSEQFEMSPALVADDVLRQVPTFSLFRRTSSLVAQPTTQGVSLRGIGPSGQSRTLVLLDGVPFNDPFGGWVYWTRVPLVSVERVELTEGTTSSLYGNSAMGGVINILTRRPARRAFELLTQYGNLETPKLDFFGSDQWNKVGVALEGSFMKTDGFLIVAPRERGPIDNNANVDYRNVAGKVEYAPSDRVNTFFRVGYFSEDRENGKVGEVNDTRWTTLSGGLQMRLPDQSDLQARVFADVQRAHFNFMAVPNASTTRDFVRLSVDQKVPTNGVGWAGQWSKTLGTSNVFSVGTDWRWVDGDSEEDVYAPSVPVSIVDLTQESRLAVKRVSGGTQQIFGAFVQDIFTPVPEVVVTLSARVDHWRNYDGHNLETTVATNLPTANHRPSIPSRDDTVFSPRGAVLYHVSDRVSVWGAANSGFRAPTLTELYRQFSVGTLVTRPNDQLGPGRLVGGEAGVRVAPTRDFTFRTTWFDNSIRDPISNVTLVQNVLAQKQNLGRTRVRGIQTDAEYRMRAFRFSGAYIFDDAKVTDGGVANAALVGKYIQQVPRNRGSLQVTFDDPKIATIAFGVQMMSLQYNDDQNVQFIPPATLVEAGYDDPVPAGLPGYAVADLVVSRDIGSKLQVFVGVQNLFGKVYFVQTNPSTIGTPRLVNVGVRIRLAGR